MTECVMHYLFKMNLLQNIQKTLISIFQTKNIVGEGCLLMFPKPLHETMLQAYIHVLTSKYTPQHNIFLTIMVLHALQGIGRWTG